MPSFIVHNAVHSKGVNLVNVGSVLHDCSFVSAIPARIYVCRFVNDFAPAVKDQYPEFSDIGSVNPENGVAFVSVGGKGIRNVQRGSKRDLNVVIVSAGTAVGIGDGNIHPGWIRNIGGWIFNVIGIEHRAACPPVIQWMAAGKGVQLYKDPIAGFISGGDDLHAWIGNNCQVQSDNAVAARCGQGI